MTLPEVEEPEAVRRISRWTWSTRMRDVIVVNKPVGMVVHPAPGHPDGTLVNALLHHCAGTPSPASAAKAPWHRTPHRPGHQRPDHRRQKRCRPSPSGRSAGGSHPGPTYECLSVGQFQAGQRHRGCPHRPPPQRPQEDGRGPRRTSRHHPLGGAGPYRASPTCAAGWGRAAPIRSGSIWPISATPFWGTPCTAIEACAGPDGPMPPRHGPALSYPAPAGPWSSPAPGRRSLSGCWQSCKAHLSVSTRRGRGKTTPSHFL